MLQLLKTLLAASLLFAYTTRADTLRIGDLETPGSWSGLVATGQHTHQGDATARWLLPQPASFTYTQPNTYLSGETPPFADMLDTVAVGDWFNHRYLEVHVRLPDQRALEITCTLRPLKIGRPDYVASISSQAIVRGPGWQKVVFSLRDFNHLRHQGTFWKTMKSVSFEGTFADGQPAGDVLISQPRLKQGRQLSITTPVRSRPVRVGDTGTYDLLIENETGEERRVEVTLASTGWEACPAELSHDRVTLAPWESQTVTLSVQMNDAVAPGGRETRQVTVIPDGRGDLKESLDLITVRHLEHPYLIHTEAGWQAVAEKAKTHDWARDARQRYLDRSHAWKVPAIGTGDYNYTHRVAHDLMRCAIAWKLSGDEVLAQKAIGFLRDFTDPAKGYPTTIRCNNGSHVHRGMFFTQIARTYDLLFDHPDLTPLDHQRIETTMRLYSRWVDSMILTGDGNNHQAALVAGALLNALVLQDFAQVDRYLYGTGGYADLLGAGILDDGHYFEGTANYNILTGNICNAVAIAFEPWGIDIKNWKIPAKYGKHIMISDWALRGDFLGMSFERQGPATRTTRQLKDMWDAVLPMIDYRGVVFPTSDSVAIDLAQRGTEFASGFETAYYLWRDPAYLPLLHITKNRDLIYGVADLPPATTELGRDSYVSDNVGFAVLRSKVEGQDPRERTQAVQRYATHGGYHGHFDKTSLVALSRFGRTPHGTEASWYGYWSFMFKMWVQTSDAHNMVVVDHRMQKPNDDRRLLFHSGALMQVSATEIETPWIDPPYGGQTPYALKMPEEKTWGEGRWLPTPENPRPQGDTGTPTEPILQRRLIVVTDDYVVMSDYLRGETEHDFDNLFNCKALVDLVATQKTLLRQTAQCDPNPYGSAQFITACDWYDTEGPVKASFRLDWSKGEMGGRQSHSEPGVMDVDYHSLWPQNASVMVGNYPESHNVARRLFYRVIGDGHVLDQGQLAPWILGKTEIDLDVRGVKTLEIETRLEKARDLKTIFLGSPRLLREDGTPVDLAGITMDTENLASAPEGQDYAGGKVTIFGQDHPESLAAEPADRDQPGRIVMDLENQGVARFQATLGGDYPVGGDDVHRKIIATRSTGKDARFLSAIELHEDNPVIKSIQALSSTHLVIERHDGRTDTLLITGLDGDGSDLAVELSVQEHGAVVAVERTTPH